ncbi:hypothetical protein [Aureispira anguillae]|uniref:Uncharacterized protein n=1 Tax=Aureispira anguillae TaxID=2864201 RepID=A0A915YEF4_9BACT|nr:hypothetical protein [Aureispira anguillae]BDS11491.1 hypothetical protein AsAng_0022050 [Aureispira anguillae]
MRIAFYGSSSPIFYDYSKPNAQLSSQGLLPNPILDSAWGTMILFDELWFLAEELCPKNLKSLPYIKFLTNEIDFNHLKDLNTNAIWENLGKEKQKYFEQKKLNESLGQYQEVVDSLGSTWEISPDHHSRDFHVGDLKFMGSSVQAENVVQDLAIVEFLKLHLKKDIQLITNSFTQNWLESPDSILSQTKLTELLTIEGIPNYLNQDGPYHEIIETLREDQYLKRYREWIIEQKINYNLSELKDVKEEIENSINKFQRELMLKYLDPKSTYKSIGKSIIGAGSNLIIPGISAMVSIAGDVKEGIQKKDLMWQGFIISSKNKLNR